MDYSVKEAASLLDIAPATLRKWSVQFAALLNDQPTTTHAGARQRRYSEADIAILQQAKTLLRNGLTYDQARRQLAGAPHDDRLDGYPDVTALPPANADDHQPALAASPSVPEQVVVDDHETPAALVHKQQVQQDQIDRLRDELSRLQRENEALRTRGRPSQGTSERGFSYRLGVLLTICSALALIAISVTLFLNPGAFRAFVSNNTDLQGVPAAPSRSSPTAGAATAAPPEAASLIAQVTAAESALHTGEFTATLDYGDGVRSSTHMRFDRGDGHRAPRFSITSIYEGSGEKQTIERITIGGQSWQRQPDGRWASRPAREGMEDLLNVLLPRADTITNAEAVREADRVMLRWHNASQNTDTTLVVDPTTGIPRELHQLTRTTGEVLTVTYGGWNTPVEILPVTDLAPTPE